MEPYLIVSGNFVKTGGQDRANVALASYLAEKGVETHLVAFSVCSDLIKYPNVIFHRAPSLFRSNLLNEPAIDIVGRSWATEITKRGGRVIVNGANCNFADVNWVHFIHAAEFRRASKIPSRFSKAAAASWFFRKRERCIIPSAQVVIVHSQQTKRDAVELLEVSENRVYVVPLGIDSELFYPASAEQRFELRNQLGLSQNRLLACFIGGFAGERKGFDVLFSAWQSLCQDAYWDVDLLVIGDGASLAEWQVRSRNAGLAARICFLGMRDDVPKLLRASDLFVLPSRYETYSLSTQEALCSGVPAFVSSASGIAERYPLELSDLLIRDPNNVEELVSKLKDWRRRHNEYYCRTESFAQEIRDFTWDKMAEKIVDTIEASRA